MGSRVVQKVCQQTLLASLSMLIAGGAFAKAVEVVQPKKAVQSTKKVKTLPTQLPNAVPETALTPAELLVAQLIQSGQVSCELGVSVSVKADPAMPGYFDVQSQKFKFRMTPVVTSTGAIRLEDSRAGAVWLQLANKSMLMSQKLGSRLADECKNPSQIAVSDAMLKSPPVSLLEPVSLPVQKAVVASPPLISPLSASN